MLPPTRFTDPLAVEAWDAWFRWRDGDVLRDATIDDTWRRVAEAIATPNGMAAPSWAHHYALAFSHWRLLPDERLLRVAGTGMGMGMDIDAGEPLAAVLNVAAFVRAPHGGQPRFERNAFVDTAALAVHLLDDAHSIFGGAEHAGLRIGIVGLGEALQKLQIDFASTSACVRARLFAIALAEGCLRGAVDLAEQRGARGEFAPSQLASWRLRGMPPRLLERASRHGLRHLLRTAIERHPTLAKFADNTSDAIDPWCSTSGIHVEHDEIREARREIGAAMQPWIDLPIERPLVDPPGIATNQVTDDVTDDGAAR